MSAILISHTHTLAQSERPRLLPPVVNTGGKEDPNQKDKDKKDKDKKDKGKDKTLPEKLTEPPQTDVFSQLVVPRTETQGGYNPHMLGDWSNKFVRQTITLYGTQSTTTTNYISGFAVGSTTTTSSGSAAAQTRTILAPLPNQGAFKVAENEKPAADRSRFRVLQLLQQHLYAARLCPGVIDDHDYRLSPGRPNRHDLDVHPQRTALCRSPSRGVRLRENLLRRQRVNRGARADHAANRHCRHL